jgi:L-lactate dehydrogenase complex protein LldE
MPALTLFVPCYVDWLAPGAAIAAVHVLERLGHEVEYRPSVLCCGQPLTNAGAGEPGDRVTARWFQEMRDATTVVVLSSSCTTHVWHQAQHMCGPTESSLRVFEFCQFLDDTHAHVHFGHLERTVCLHSACHGLREGSIDRHARRVLERIEGLNVVQTERADECCGFGGTFSVSFPDLSVRMGDDRISEIVHTGATEVTATDASCLLHLRGIAEARGARLAFRHVAELLDEALTAGAATTRRSEVAAGPTSPRPAPTP